MLEAALTKQINVLWYCHWRGCTPSKRAGLWALGQANFGQLEEFFRYLPTQFTYLETKFSFSRFRSRQTYRFLLRIDKRSWHCSSFAYVRKPYSDDVVKRAISSVEASLLFSLENETGDHGGALSQLNDHEGESLRYIHCGRYRMFNNALSMCGIM